MVCCVLLWSNPSILFWNNFVYIYIYTSSGQKKTPIRPSPLGNFRKMVFNNYLHYWIFPTYFLFLSIFSYFSLFLPYSLHVLSKKTVGMSGKGQAFGFYRFLSFWVFSSLWASWVVLAAVFWEVQGISNTPKIISPLEKSHKIVFNLALSCSGFPNLSYFPLFRHISPIFLSFASKERW